MNPVFLDSLRAGPTFSSSSAHTEVGAEVMPYNKLLFSVELLAGSAMDSTGAVQTILRPVAVCVQVETVVQVVQLGLKRRRVVQANESDAVRLQIGLAVRVLAALRVARVSVRAVA